MAVPIEMQEYIKKIIEHAYVKARYGFRNPHEFLYRAISELLGKIEDEIKLWEDAVKKINEVFKEQTIVKLDDLILKVGETINSIPVTYIIDRMLNDGLIYEYKKGEYRQVSS
ncbi:MAG: hypothetical protein ACP6IU_13085 [Candidatus Asgardarchaeia archaeon]